MHDTDAATTTDVICRTV